MFLSQQAEEDNEQRKRQEQILMEKLLEQEAMLQEDQKVSACFCTPPPSLVQLAAVGHHRAEGKQLPLTFSFILLTPHHRISLGLLAPVCSRSFPPAPR